MNKIKFNKLSICLIIMMFMMGIFTNSVNATEDVSKVQNVKVSYQDDGSIYVTWDKVKSENYVTYNLVTYYNELLWGYNYYMSSTNVSIDLPDYYIGNKCTIRVRASIDNGRNYGDFSDPISFKHTLGKVKNLTNTSRESSILISWTELVNAQKYEIYLYNDLTGNYEFNGSTTDNKFEIKNLKVATKYKIKVRPIAEVDGEIIYGEYSDELKMMTAPSKVKNIKTFLVTKGVKLTWDKAYGATGYRIYRSTSKDGHYYEIKTIDKNTNNYTDETAYSGGRFYYKIKSFTKYNNKRNMGQNSKIVTQVFVAAPKVSLKSYNDKTTIKWDKVSSASGYEIYRATSKAGEYEKIKTITKGKTTIYTDKKIKSKKLYYYKVRSYQTRSGKKYYSAYSSIKEKTIYAQVEITKATYNSSKKSNTLKWKKISGVTGYKIYKATSKNGTYKHIKTISKSTTTTYTDKNNIGVGKLYYYKIRAYRKNGEKTVYGQYSSAKKRTTGTREQQMNKIKLKPGTSGFTELDKEYTKIINKVTKGKKTVYDKVKAVYKYAVENMSHDDYHCKHFAGTFAGLMKVLGIEDIYCARGDTTTVSGGWTVHTWVIIEINDTKYVFDTSIDKHTLERTGKINYGRFFKTEGEVSRSYKLSYYHSDGWPILFSKGAVGIIVY